MTEVNNLTNIAREIVSKLDAEDKKVTVRLKHQYGINLYVTSKAMKSTIL